MVSCCDMKVDEVQKKVPEIEQDIDRLTQQVQNIFELRISNNPMDVIADQYLDKNKAITEFTNFREALVLFHPNGVVKQPIKVSYFEGSARHPPSVTLTLI